ncbi:hypothetical protein CHS0354_038299 [Potamilus streckersoni]|uniref:Ricin B lectin domain-containing protein n=1 Tax=Potamilus streckersoni TaxID=2493646 RepID=A0AAE0TCK1_9BIVA|nr:hypothetical protein CHS0354_038299 [Potamilus streckersoni]
MSTHGVQNVHTNQCLDNYQNLLPHTLYVSPCHYKLATQGFSWMKNKQLRTSLLCVAVNNEGQLMLERCTTEPMDTWEHVKSGYLKHEKSGLCLDLDHKGPILKTCTQDAVTQSWEFNHYPID